MGLQKGRTNNPCGRKRGSRNKVSKDLRQAITDFLEGNFCRVQENFNLMSPITQMKVFIDLLPYCLPRLSSTELKNDLDKLTSEQVDVLTDKLIEKLSSNE
jgi:hypothetical protein